MDEFLRSVEATVFASAEPLTVAEIAAHAGEGDVEAALSELAERYQGHGVELVERGGRWHFQTAADLAHLLRRTRIRGACPGLRRRRWPSSHITSL